MRGRIGVRGGSEVRVEVRGREWSEKRKRGAGVE